MQPTLSPPEFDIIERTVKHDAETIVTFVYGLLDENYQDISSDVTLKLLHEGFDWKNINVIFKYVTKAFLSIQHRPPAANSIQYSECIKLIIAVLAYDSIGPVSSVTCTIAKATHFLAKHCMRRFNQVNHGDETSVLYGTILPTILYSLTLLTSTYPTLDWRFGYTLLNKLDERYANDTANNSHVTVHFVKEFNSFYTIVRNVIGYFDAQSCACVHRATNAIMMLMNDPHQDLVTTCEVALEKDRTNQGASVASTSTSTHLQPTALPFVPPSCTLPSQQPQPQPRPQPQPQPRPQAQNLSGGATVFLRFPPDLDRCALLSPSGLVETGIIVNGCDVLLRPRNQGFVMYEGFELSAQGVRELMLILSESSRLVSEVVQSMRSSSCTKVKGDVRQYTIASAALSVCRLEAYRVEGESSENYVIQRDDLNLCSWYCLMGSCDVAAVRPETREAVRFLSETLIACEGARDAMCRLRCHFRNESYMK